ncbi:MAG TPA: hypothetical protein VHO66_05930, partial [Ruminiclostridium sp.]|nr:hypothetical protein [Ruminiclostridium sp.]
HLIAPVLEENAQRRLVYLPHGVWYDLFTGEMRQGSQTVEVICSDRIPVYLRAGYGIALNLDASLELGESVGNRVDGYKNLHFLLAGENGTCQFKDDLGNDFTLEWNKSTWKQSGHSVSPFTVKIV